MDLLFGRRKTPEELLRQNQRALNRAMRELDRERQKLETQEKKIIADIKKMAKQGQMVSLIGNKLGLQARCCRLVRTWGCSKQDKTGVDIRALRNQERPCEEPSAKCVRTAHVW